MAQHFFQISEQKFSRKEQNFWKVLKNHAERDFLYYIAREAPHFKDFAPPVHFQLSFVPFWEFTDIFVPF